MEQISFTTGNYVVKIYKDGDRIFTDLESCDELGFAQLLWYLTGDDIIENTFIALERIAKMNDGKLEPIQWNKNY